MKTQAACVHASRGEPCWGLVLPTVGGHDGVMTCAGHYYVEATGGGYVAQGERHAFESRIEAMRKPVEFVELSEMPRDVAYREMQEKADLGTLADLTDPVTED